MTGIVAQIIALTAYGNDFLKQGNIPVDFYSANTTFQHCNKVDFREFKRQFFFLKPKEHAVANDPIEWFHYLKSEGCVKLRLYFEHSDDQSFAKDYKLAGLVGGGGTWLIEAVYDNYSNYWANRWEVSHKNAPNNKIWTVNYGMTAKKQKSINLQIDNQEIKEQFRLTLTEISAFAVQQNLNDWSDQFEAAKITLDSLTPETHFYHTDLIPIDKYSLTAKQLVFAAGTAWVFGGMGSWNDLGFSNKENEETYDRLSEQLYSSINEAIIAGTNTY